MKFLILEKVNVGDIGKPFWAYDPVRVFGARDKADGWIGGNTKRFVVRPLDDETPTPPLNDPLELE